MKPITREQILDLRKSFEVWQQDYDPLHDKEQHDMFSLGVMAMDEMLATMDSEAARCREWMARGVEMSATYLCEWVRQGTESRIEALAANIRVGEIE